MVRLKETLGFGGGFEFCEWFRGTLDYGVEVLSGRTFDDGVEVGREEFLNCGVEWGLL